MVFQAEGESLPGSIFTYFQLFNSNWKIDNESLASQEKISKNIAKSIILADCKSVLAYSSSAPFIFLELTHILSWHDYKEVLTWCKYHHDIFYVFCETRIFYSHDGTGLKKNASAFQIYVLENDKCQNVSMIRWNQRESRPISQLLA